MYAVDADDESISIGWDTIENYEQEQSVKVGKMCPKLSEEITKTNSEVVTVTIVQKINQESKILRERLKKNAKSG